jgi:hypothetical protein
MVLVQRTRDERAAQFVVAIAKSLETREFSPKVLTAWFAFAKQILAGNTTPGFGTATVEPNTFVKNCALQVLDALLPVLAKREPLLTACLDDLMTSSIRAVESAKTELHAIAFPLLNSVVNAFRNRRTEGQGMVLDLYEAQFSIASRYAFESIDTSAEYLVTYLDFYFENVGRNHSSLVMLLDEYVAGLSKVIDKSRGFCSVASKICAFCRSSENLFGHFTPFLKTLTPLFSELVVDSIKLRSTVANWSDISEYRYRMASFYSDMLFSFVWLQHVFPLDEVLITVERMIAYFLLEMSTSSESWRIYGAFAAFSAVFQYVGRDVPLELFDLIVAASADSSRRNLTLLRHLVPDFLLYAAALTDKTPEYANIWSGLVSILLSNDNECGPTALAYILRNSQTTDFAGRFARFIVGQLVKANYGQEEALALITILFDTAPMAIPLFIKILAEPRRGMDEFVNFRLAAFRRALVRCETREAIDRVAAFCIRNFAGGGMEAIAQILVRRPAIGMEFLARGAAKQAIAKLDDGLNEAKQTLPFLSLVLAKLRGQKRRLEIATEIAKAAYHVIVKYGGDKRRGRELVIEAVGVVREAERMAPTAALRAFRAESEGDQNFCTACLKKIVEVPTTGAKLSLKKFATGHMTRKAAFDGDWQSVDIDGG